MEDALHILSSHTAPEILGLPLDIRRRILRKAVTTQGYLDVLDAEGANNKFLGDGAQLLYPRGTGSYQLAHEAKQIYFQGNVFNVLSDCLPEFLSVCPEDRVDPKESVRMINIIVKACAPSCADSIVNKLLPLLSCPRLEMVRIVVNCYNTNMPFREKRARVQTVAGIIHPLMWHLDSAIIRRSGPHCNCGVSFIVEVSWDFEGTSIARRQMGSWWDASRSSNLATLTRLYHSRFTEQGDRARG